MGTMFGALLAKNKNTLIDRFKNLNLSMRIMLLLFGLFIYTNARTMRILPTDFIIIMADWEIALGVSIIISVLSSRTLSNLLNNKILILNGQLSFSLYLYHVLVLITVIHLFENSSNLTKIFISLILMYIISYISWRLVKKPSIRLGKKIKFSSKVDRKEKRRIS